MTFFHPGYIQEDEPVDASTSNCVKCGRRVDLQPSPHFKTVCGAECVPPPPYGPIKTMPTPYRDR